ncbi:MAG: AI-2E family transporter, partial [Parcubacteria group bacterium]|nr:AI-2E family transporter [Parcubacteria group bacterium]
SFYFTVQEDSLKKFIRSLAPMKHRPYIENLAGRIQKQIGYWLRGQIMLGLVVGIMLYVGLSLLGVKYALILAILGGLLEIVPYLGPIISAVPAVFLAFTQRPILALFVLILYIAVQQLENHILVPKVMQRVVGLNPLVTIIVILVGVKVAGIIGGILAVPIATAIQVFLSDIFEIKDEKDKEKLKEEICKARAGDSSGLSGKDRKLREELREEVCEEEGGSKS